MDEEEKKDEESKDGEASGVDGIPNPYGEPDPKSFEGTDVKSGFIGMVKKAKEKVEARKNKEAAEVVVTPQPTVI